MNFSSYIRVDTQIKSLIPSCKRDSGGRLNDIYLLSNLSMTDYNTRN